MYILLIYIDIGKYFKKNKIKIVKLISFEIILNTMKLSISLIIILFA